jgi:pimeloyl-ACP methyl ester carboxylesterase
MSEAPQSASRLALIEDAFSTLPARYLGGRRDFHATVLIELTDVGRTWEVRCDGNRARVSPGPTRRADVTIETDSETWLRLHHGELSGLKAFRDRLLSARGDLELALAYESLFRRPAGRRPLLEPHEVDLGGRRISVLSVGSGADVLLLHGLGGAKRSFVHVAAELGRRYRVHAVDLPGFGASSKPVFAPYTVRYFAESVRATLDALGIERTHVVGNSIGGRVAIELALRHPDRVGRLALLCPAVAVPRRSQHPIVRLTRPELGLVSRTLARGLVERQFWSLFADASAVDGWAADLVIDEVERIYRSAGARAAFLTAARSIYLEAPFGPRGFYPRLTGLAAPALFVWGAEDRLVPAASARHVQEWLPEAEQVVLEQCGHVPQLERPAQIVALLERFLESRAPARRSRARRPAVRRPSAVRRPTA